MGEERELSTASLCPFSP